MTKKQTIETLLKDNILLATGCTEPVAVALSVAKAKELLNKTPEKIHLCLSPNIIKNAMGVGIPGTNMIGLPIAIALGAVGGDSSKELNVLNDSKEHLEQAKNWLKTSKIEISHAKNVDKLYIECNAFADNKHSKVVIAKTHNNFVHLQIDDDIILQKEQSTIDTSLNNTNQNLNISSKDVFEYSTQTDLRELEWIMDTVEIIEQASNEGLKQNYGLNLGQTLINDEGNSLRKRVIAKTCAASDARMGGAQTPVYSNSGSGNQGITCTIPVYEFAKLTNQSREKTIRALMLSHLMSIYIKQYIGRLSALCGIVNASIGVSSALVYLQNGSYEQVCFAIKNMINTITGMICDGAKPSCALKISAGLNAAFDCSTLAIKNIVVDESDGISEKDIERSIKNLGKIGRYGMDEIDNLILEIMTQKEC